MATTDSYNIETYVRAIHDVTRPAFPNGPVRVGERAPHFRLPLVGGGTADLESLLDQGHLVVVFGCFTAPPCLWQLPALEALYRAYQGRGCDFLFVYTREIHPGEYFPPHRSTEQKLNQAEQMRDFGRISFPIAADDLNGSTHRAYGELPSMACAIRRDGTLVYRGAWTVAGVIGQVLEDLVRRDQLEAQGPIEGRWAYHEWISNMEREPQATWDLLDLAGPKARADNERANARGRPTSW